MILQTPTRIVLILAVSVLLSGCALKPKQKSRFHRPVASNGECNCFTCRNRVSTTPQPPAQVIEGACDACEVYESAPFDAATAAPMNTGARPLYEVPESSELKNDLPVEPSKLADQEMPVIKEIQPFETNRTLDLNTDPSLGGGSFNPLKSNEAVVVPPKTEDIPEAPKVAPLEKTELTDATESTPFSPKSADLKEALEEATKPLDIDPVKVPKAVEATKPVEIAKPVEVTKPIEVTKPVEVTKSIEATKPVEVAKPIEVPKKLEVAKPVEVKKAVEVKKTVEVAKPVEIPKPIEKLEVAEPKSSFQPGQPFKPGRPFKPKKKVSPTDASWNDIDANFYQHGADENFGNEEVLAANEEPAMLPARDPVNTFFGRTEQPEAQPLRNEKQVSSGRVVLQANPVERSVVFMPPSKSVSMVKVPALRSSFKAGNPSENWLRGDDHLAKTMPASQQSEVVYEQTEAPTLAVKQIAKPVAPTQTPVVTVEDNEPRSLAVRLRAIPMNNSTRRQLSEARFREHQPMQRIAQNDLPPQRAAEEKPVLTVEPQKPVEIKQPELNIRVATPPKTEQTPHTARALSDEFVTPPWRLK